MDDPSAFCRELPVIQKGSPNQQIPAPVFQHPELSSALPHVKLVLDIQLQSCRDKHPITNTSPSVAPR